MRLLSQSAIQKRTSTAKFCPLSVYRSPRSSSSCVHVRCVFRPIRSRSKTCGQNAEDEVSSLTVETQTDADLLSRAPGSSPRSRAPGSSLVERYDAVKFGIFQRNLSNLRGLVLFCIEAEFCNQILIFNHLLACFELYQICNPLHRSNFKI